MLFLIPFVVAGAAIFFAREAAHRQESMTRAGTVAHGRSAVDPGAAGIAKKIAAMSLEEKIGQMLMVAIPDAVLSPQTADWLRSHYIGGVILLGPNVKGRTQVAQLIRDLQDNARASTDPLLFIAADQEGGAVSRFLFLDVLIAQREIGNKEQAFETGRRRGIELKALGISINFSPVMDVASSSADFIFSRAFHGDAARVAELGTAMIQGYQEAGMIAVAKHFPGHGGTAIDSHKDLPTVSHNVSTMAAALLPFRAAVAAGVPIVMAGHIRISQIDPAYPASLSPAAIHILRSDMGFNGVIITDDLGMGAITRSYSLSDAAVQSVRAGADSVLVVRTIADYNKIYAALLDAVRRGDISEPQINQSVNRIRSLKEKYLKNK